jgi:hypothetical protein
MLITPPEAAKERKINAFRCLTERPEKLAGEVK